MKHMTYPVKEFDGVYYIEVYLPARTAGVWKEAETQDEDKS